jgi:NCS1 family nucleobase:cation symporter-1
MISSWSRDFLNMENTLPESAHMVTRDFIGFIIFQFISIPFMVFPPPYPIATFLTFTSSSGPKKSAFHSSSPMHLQPP